ncbi:hypothetical protein [Amaricoccus sp.]|uniref:hypothetical protein n=1 Tax=Amaricoccus sp. TaxID=1872485 RepID=UPI0026193D17|nr:hypothetical protein [uncultured Amaricoccus sp.]
MALRHRVVVYDTASGRIDHVATNVPEELVGAQALTGQSAMITTLDRVSGADWYVAGGVLAPRPSLTFDRLEITADGEDTARLERPGVWTAHIDGAAYDITGPLEFAADMPGVYVVVVEDEDAFPWLAYRAEVVAS